MEKIRTVLKHAPEAFKALDGIFCIYKPRDRSMRSIVSQIQTNLARDLNNLDAAAAPDFLTVEPGSTNKNAAETTIDDAPTLQNLNKNSDHTVDGATVSLQHGDSVSLAKLTNKTTETFVIPTFDDWLDLSDHPLVIGPRYMPEDFNVNFMYNSRLDTDASGVMLMSVGDPDIKLGLFSQAQLLRVYHVKGLLGFATQDFSHTGKLIEKSTYYHVTHSSLDRIVAAMQAGYQKHMLQAAQIDLQTQEAYELAVSGMLRPLAKEAGPVVYGMRCIHFDPPHFTLEIHTINETCIFLRKLIHDIGMNLRSTAACSHVRRIRFGHFNLSHAILRKDWRAQGICDNIALCSPLTDVSKLIRLPKLEHFEEEKTDLLPSGA